MLQTSARLLRLLSLLQVHRDWTGSQLADRLEVSSRTIRADIDKLRNLGYPVHASPGVSGGYRLSAGETLPPLVLDDDDAVAIAVSLRTAADGTVEGLEESAIAALAKLQQILPPTLRRRVDALQSYTVGGSARAGGPMVDARQLTLIAETARDREILRFGYANQAGTATERRVEPYRLINSAHRWYLFAFDIERNDWRTFRVDRMTETRSVGHRFRRRELPAYNLADDLAAKTQRLKMTHHYRVIVSASPNQITDRMGSWIEGTVEPLDPERCMVRFGGTSADDVAFWLGVLDADFEVVDSPELAAAVSRIADRYARATL